MRMAIVQRPDNSVVVWSPSPKFSDAETDADFFRLVTLKAFGPDGSQLVMDDDEAVIKAQLPWAGYTQAHKDIRRFRRNAAKWDPIGLVIVDDDKITTVPERIEAIAWEQETAIGKPDAARSAAERKLAAGRPDLLSTGDMDDIVVRWRGSGKAPASSSFTPPADRVRPQPPSRRR